ncbi:hypothetical protein CTAYLR_007821 [Chrysophaeum taylorii]|uniref:Vesicle transport protein n=1 Tax=Chrysophaeum taylorii TaxID=2483200 RepID=A0AAD7UAA8_9STRA|nr:hypothetical protein CTAYLR_007821 [Chrysophaeum taylorii]
MVFARRTTYGCSFLVVVGLLAVASTAGLAPPRHRPLLTLRGGSYSKNGLDDAFYGLDEGWNGEAYVGDAYDYDQPSSSSSSSSSSKRQRRDVDLPILDRKTGLVMLAAGAVFTMLGISLFFEKNLIRLGNLLLVGGAPLVVGPSRATRYLMDPSKLRGTVVFALGFFLVLSGHPLLGIVVEVFGFFNLFGNLFPLLGAMIARLPFMSTLASFSQEPTNPFDPRDMY